MKAFKYVEVGETATNYFLETFIIHDKGTAEEMFKKHGKECHFGLSDFCEPELGTDENTPVIVEKHEPTELEGTTITIWYYGDEGAYVPMD